ncbi:hypothetical protein RRG08_002281 [Elysia crispata]|uniref:Calx-beta domain-containing protein n=1 Tax=Elysia crispata TaxID=231223 RepID=A0AAE0ZAT9_9GAST|nr:hypothetical protein RRG08_002281 [Elysia crispata]
MANNHYSYYSRGFVVEYLDTGEDRCSSWLLLPAENLWPQWFRGLLYCIALFYFFVGIAIASDIFMCSIEVITARKRTISKWDPEKNEMVQREVLIWNETVANLTLMALGSSAPEILLAVVEAVTSLDDEEPADSLGTFTIIGSAAFNMLIITAVCIISVPLPQSKSIKEFGVFVVTGVWSIWAYIWMLLVVDYISPGVVEPWEAWVTLLFLPVLVLMAYLQDLGWCCCSRKRVGDSEDVDDPTMSVRVVTSHPHPQFMGHQHKELHVLEAQKAHRMSVSSELWADLRNKRYSTTSEQAQTIQTHTTPEKELQSKINKPSTTLARARFRHAVVGSLLGSKAFRPHSNTRPARLAEVVEVVSSWNEAMKQGKAPDLADSLGKFTFGSDRYAVLESAGKLDIEIFFHRKVLPNESLSNKTSGRPRHKLLNLKPTPALGNGNATSGQDNSSLTPPDSNVVEPTTPSSVAPSVTEAVTVDFETREGSAKPGKDFRYTQGTLVFQENEYRKVISIPIINDNQYEADVDFYVILKNAHGGAGIGDPSVTRITIVDDDEPGEFEFEKSHYHIDMKTGKVTIRVMREHGFDGKVSMDYNTTDGSAVGGKTLGSSVDYISTHGTLTFEHGETSKTIYIEANKNVKDAKNFIISLRNPSLGAMIGVKSAAVCHFNRDELIERVAEILGDDDDEEETTWGGQFVSAMTVSTEPDDDGNETEPRWYHYVMHFISFFWKIFCSIIPPTTILGAWPTFVLSLLFIGMMTACVEQLGKLLGCVIGIKTSVTGITIIALGTSLPDTFASRTAAMQDEHADAAIGNITGSNSVNVFLGLGLPWIISTMYHLAKGTDFKVKSEDLVQSVVIFSICGTACFIFLVIRRKFLGGELGGQKNITKYLSSAFLVTLWLIYIILSSLKAYDILKL